LVTKYAENPFWDFSLAIYGRSGVADACLALQDRRGLDVNLLLFCCWAGSRGRKLDATEVANLIASVADWQRSVLRPLRLVRRQIKEFPGGDAGQLGLLRTVVKDCELTAERVDQRILYEAVPPSAPTNAPAAGQAACAAANLTAYLEAAGLSADSADRTHLDSILRGAFGSLPPKAAKSLDSG
jgi:uncharacterized protein (TIGR02444 family)